MRSRVNVSTDIVDLRTTRDEFVRLLRRGLRRQLELGGVRFLVLELGNPGLALGTAALAGVALVLTRRWLPEAARSSCSPDGSPPGVQLCNCAPGGGLQGWERVMVLEMTTLGGVPLSATLVRGGDRPGVEFQARDGSVLATLPGDGCERWGRFVDLDPGDARLTLGPVDVARVRAMVTGRARMLAPVNS